MRWLLQRGHMDAELSMGGKSKFQSLFFTVMSLLLVRSWIKVKGSRAPSNEALQQAAQLQKKVPPPALSDAPHSSVLV